MSILTWGLKEGDEVEVHSPTEDNKITVKITNGPFKNDDRGSLWINYGRNETAFFSEHKQRWLSSFIAVVGK